MNLVVEITRRCNLKCIHCMRGEPEDRFMGDSTIESLIDRMFEYREGLDIVLTGGEPFLNPEAIIKIADACFELEAPLSVLTNGTVPVDEKVALAIHKIEKVHSYTEGGIGIGISSDAFPDLYPEPAVDWWRFVNWKKRKEFGGSSIWTHNLGFSGRPKPRIQNLGRARKNRAELEALDYEIVEPARSYNPLYTVLYDGRIVWDCDYEYGKEPEIVGHIEEPDILNRLSGFLQENLLDNG